MGTFYEPYDPRKTIMHYGVRGMKWRRRKIGAAVPVGNPNYNNDYYNNYYRQPGRNRALPTPPENRQGIKPSSAISDSVNKVTNNIIETIDKKKIEKSNRKPGSIRKDVDKVANNAIGIIDKKKIEKSNKKPKNNLVSNTKKTAAKIQADYVNGILTGKYGTKKKKY